MLLTSGTAGLFGFASAGLTAVTISRRLSWAIAGVAAKDRNSRIAIGVRMLQGYIMRPNLARRGASHHRGQLVLSGRADQLGAPELLEQLLHGELADTGDGVQFGGELPRVPARAVERDGEAV